MERLAAKKRKGILSRMPKESNEDILVGLKKAELAAGGRKATQADVESVNEELELANAQDKLDARKPAGKLKERPDIKLEGLKSSTDIVQEAMQKPSNQKAFLEPKATTAEERADLEKKYGSWRGAKEVIKAEGDRYRAALQPKKGFEEQYDADVKFQEEEYGGGSIRREMELDEIRGPRDPETGVREAALGENPAEYDKQYAKLEKENPNMSETELQDAAIKAVRAKQATDAEDAAKDFNTVDYGDEMEDEVRRKRLEAEKAEAAAKKKETDITKAAVETAKKTGPGGADTRRQLTPQQIAAKKAAEEERRRAEEKRRRDEEERRKAEEKRRRDEEERQQNAELAETTTDEAIEDTVDETSTEESIDAAARKEQAKDSKEATEREALDAGFANVRMPGLRKQSSELYNSFDKAYSSMYPSQEEMNSNPGARRRLVQRRNALDTIKNKLFRSSPDQWGNRPYGTGMNLDDAIKELEDELPTATKQIKQMVRRMRGFHILMNRYGEDAQLKGAFDLENLLRNTRLRGDKPPEESGEVLRPIRTSGTIPQEALDKYPMFEDVDEGFTGLTVSADYGDHVDIPEGKEFSYTVFPNKYRNLPLEQQYEYVVMTDGTKYLYKTDPENPDNYLDPVEISEITELSPSESIIASAAAGE